MEFYDWQLVIVIGGIRHEACACLLSGVGVDGLMGTWGRVNNN